MSELYEIKTRTFTEAIARLVDTFKKHNPGIGKFECTCLDGSRVRIVIANNDKPVRRERGSR